MISIIHKSILIIINNGFIILLVSEIVEIGPKKKKDY